MARYLLDTNILIDLSKRVDSVRAVVRQWLAGGEEVGISPIQIVEFYAGVHPEELPAAAAFLQPFALWEISRAAARTAGMDRYAFARRGRQISLADATTAAVAQFHDAILVTNNIKDFPMTSLRLLLLRG